MFKYANNKVFYTELFIEFKPKQGIFKLILNFLYYGVTHL